MRNVNCVCALFIVILGNAYTFPVNATTDLNAVISATCPSLNNKLPLPEECAKGKDNKVNPICFVIVDYVLELCHENKTDVNNYVEDKTEVCSRTLKYYKPHFKENSQILVLLNNKTSCLKECEEHPLLCNRVFHLSQLLENKDVSNSQPAIASSVSDNAAEKEQSNTNSKEQKPESVKSGKQSESSLNGAVSNKETPKIPVSSSVAKEEVKETENKPEVVPDTSKNVEANNSPTKTISETNSAPLKLDGMSSPGQSVSRPASPPQEIPPPDHVENVPPAIDEKAQAGEDQPEDQLDETVQKSEFLEDEETPEDNKEEFIEKPEGMKVNKLPSAGFTPEDGPNQAISESNGVFQESPDSHFFAYFLFFTCLTILAYIAFHNKNKILALALEGRRGRNGRRRPNTAGYHKVGTNLEEAMSNKPSRDSATRVPF